MINRKSEIHFAELELGGGEETVMVIPPRAHTEQPVRRNRSVDQEVQLNLSISSSTREQQFVEQARIWEQRVDPAAPFVPFMCYWPQYGDMSEGQTRWYFYWRNEVREGRYPTTDLSYIFLCIYELINGIGWKEPEQGCRLMKDIWIAYREAFPKLDFYMLDWMIDFILVHHLDIPVRDVSLHAPSGASGDVLELELMNRFMSQPPDLPLEVVNKISNYNVMRSKFYTDGGQAELHVYIPKVFAAVDGYMAKKYGTRLIELFHPGEAVRRERYLFRSAVYDSSLYGSSVAMELIPVSSHGPLREFATQLIRLTENTLRELRGYKGRLRGIAIEDEIAALVKRYLEREYGRTASAEQTRPAVRINADKLAQLQSDSDKVRDLLTVADEVGEPECRSRSGDVQEHNEPLAAATVEQHGNAEGFSTVDVPEGLCTELDEVQTLLSRLTEEQLLLLNSLIANDWELNEKALADQAAHIMIELEIDEINEAALEVLGNLLIVEEAGLIIIEEDYRDELAGRNTEPAGHRDGLDEEWVQFGRMLEPVHREALQALAAGGDQTSLMKLANAHGTMAELLFDEINAASMDAIGDLIIDGDAIADDYLPMIEKLVR